MNFSAIAIRASLARPARVNWPPGREFLQKPLENFSVLTLLLIGFAFSEGLYLARWHSRDP